MSKAKIAVVCAAIAAGIFGFFIGHKTVQVPDASKFRRADAPSIAETARLADEVAALRKENQRLNAQLQQTIASEKARDTEFAKSGVGDEKQRTDDAAARLRALADLQKQGIANVDVTFVDRSGKIGEGFVQLFDLSRAERDALQQAVDHVRQQLDEAAIAAAKVSRDGAGNVLIDIPPSTGGEQLYDQLFDSFAQTLGSTRNAAFFDLNNRQLENALHQFGAEQRTLTISRGTPKADGSQTFSLKDERKTPLGSSRSTGNYSRARLVESLGPIAKLLPSDFHTPVTSP